MVRKGTEDYEYLRLVEQGIDRLGEAHPAAVRAQTLLQEIASELLPSHSEYTRSDTALQTARRRLAAAIIELEVPA